MMPNDEVHDVLKTRRLEIVDGEGRTRVSLHEDDQAFILMRFFDLSGHLKMNLGLGQDGAANVSLCCGDGHPRIMMLALNDGSSQICAYTGLPENVKGTETPCWQLYIAPDGSFSKMTFLNEKGKPAVLMGADGKGNSSIGVFQDQQMVWVAPNDCPQSKPPRV